MAIFRRDILQRNLKAKFAILMALLLVAVFSVTGIAMVRSNAGERLELVEQRGSMLVSMQAESIAAPLWNVDIPQVEAALAAMQRDPAFAGARVISPKGEVIAKAGNPALPDQLSFTADVVKEGENLGRLELALSKTRLQETLVKDQITTAAILGTVMAAILGGFLALLGFIFRPLDRIRRAMASLSSGVLDTDVPHADRIDEIGAIARSVEVFKQNAIDKDRVEAEAAEAKRKIEEENRLQTRQMADTFEADVGKVVDGLAGASQELEDAANAMSMLAENVTSRAATVATASERAAQNVETVAAAAEELSSSVREISRQVGESADVARNAVIEAEQTDETMRSLADAAGRIGTVIQLINDIASQTNLLALNATIEAARAGEAGKGFAVVANEVKSLANQTAKATDEIAQQIGRVQSETTRAVQAIQHVGMTIARISEISTAIASAVEEQGAATQEIARNVELASHGTREASANISGVSSAAGEAGKASLAVLQSARGLSGDSTRLRETVGKFLSRVRA